MRNKMESGILVLAACLSFMLIILSGCNLMEKRIDANHIGKEVKIDGTLGISLGEIVTIEGIVLDDAFRGNRADSGKFFLKVNSINGEMPGKPVVVALEIFKWSGIKNPEVNEKKKYIGYETGKMDGIPDEAFKYLPRVATSGYHFLTYFQVCKELKK